MEARTRLATQRRSTRPRSRSSPAASSATKSKPRLARSATIRPPGNEFVGTAVPKQVELKTLPKKVADVLHGFYDQDYVAAGDKLVIAETSSRRVAAVVTDAVPH